MERLKREWAIAPLLVALWVALFGCGARLPDDYRDRPFTALVFWQTNGTAVTARFETDGTGKTEMVLTSPEGLAGVTLTAEGEKRTLRCGHAVLEGGYAQPLFDVMALMLPVGERRAVCEAEWGGERVWYAEITGDVPTELYLSRERGVPVALRRGEICLEILEFEYAEEDSA